MRASKNRGSAPKSRGKTVDPAELIATWPRGEVTTPYAKLRILLRGVNALVELDGTESSCLNLADPTYLEFEYHQHLDLLLRCHLDFSQPLRALHLGGCGCALARAWDARYGQAGQVAVEIDPYLVENVRTWFALPTAPRLRIRQGDAWEVLQSLRGASWPVIVKDVYAAGQVPPQFCTPEYAQQVCRVLDRSTVPGPSGLCGLYLANLAANPLAAGGGKKAGKNGNTGALPGGLVTNAAGQARDMALQEIAHLRAAGMEHFAVVADPKVWRAQRVGNVVLAGSFSPLNVEEISRQARKQPLPTGVFTDF